MRFMAIAIFVFTALNALAEERCQPSDTPRQCVQRLITTRAYENAQNVLAATSPGTSTVASPVRSAVKDFLSSASAQVERSSSNDSGSALIVGYNLLKRINLEATVAHRGDDMFAVASYNLLTRYFGRNVDRSLFDSILLPLISNAATADMPLAAAQLGSDLAQVANRQPQLFVSGIYRRRAAAAGPDEHGFRLTWEIGMDNVNTFRRHEGRGCEKRGDCLEAFTKFADRTAKHHPSGRLSLAIQYGKTALNDAGTFTQVPTNGFTYLATYGQEIPSFTGQPARFDLSYTYDGKKTARGFMTPLIPEGTVIPPSSIRDSIAFTITQSISRNFSVPLSVVRLKHDDWLPGAKCDLIHPAPDPGVPRCTPPAHRLFSKTEVVLSIHYQLPPFPRPPQTPSCCCK